MLHEHESSSHWLWCCVYLKVKKDIHMTVFRNMCLFCTVQCKMSKYHFQPGHSLACFAVTCMTLSKSARSFMCLEGMAVEQNLNKIINLYCLLGSHIPYPTAFPYGNGMVLHFYQQQESSTTKTVHKVINKGLKAYE